MNKRFKQLLMGIAIGSLSTNLAFASVKDTDWTAKSTHNRAAAVVLDTYTAEATTPALEELKASLQSGKVSSLNEATLRQAGLGPEAAKNAMKEIRSLDDQN